MISRSSRRGLSAAAAVAVVAVLGVVACATFPTVRQVASNPTTGLELRVTLVSGASHAHPATVTEDDVRNALLSSGYFIDADVRALGAAMVAELGRLLPSERLWLEGSNADFHVFVEGGELVLVSFQVGREFSRSRYAIHEARTAPAPVAAAPAPVLPVAEPKATRGGRIWTFAVGISNYAQHDISLRYAHRDAEAIDAFFAGPGGGSVPAERRTLLVNEGASRSAILSSLNSVAKRVAPDDMLIMYLAMHGLPDEGGDLYFLAHDTEPGQLVGTGLPQRDVEYALASSPAKRVVMLLDACHAGAAGTGGYRGKRGLVLAETNRLLARLAQTKPGLAVLTASSATESSNEGEKWGGGHGVFTHHLLGGMRGEADADGDALVSVRELFDFVYRRVSDDTGGSQHPELKGTFDNLMPVAHVVGAPPRP